MGSTRTLLTSQHPSTLPNLVSLFKHSEVLYHLLYKMGRCIWRRRAVLSEGIKARLVRLTRSLASRIFSSDKPELQNLVRRGESEQLEFKQSSAQFPRDGETLCAFMNGRGGQVLVGVRPDGSVVGQTIADKTLQDLAQVLRRFDPPIPVETERIPAGTRRRTPWRRRSMP